MACRGGERVETFQDNMALVRILQNDTKGHKMPFLMNFINTAALIELMQWTKQPKII